MTITHGALPLFFTRKASKHPVTRPTHPAVEQAPFPVPAGLTCAPWEGLCLEDAETAFTHEAPAPNPELERFLFSLMSGE